MKHKIFLYVSSFSILFIVLSYISSLGGDEIRKKMTSEHPSSKKQEITAARSVVTQTIDDNQGPLESNEVSMVDENIGGILNSLNGDIAEDIWSTLNRVNFTHDEIDRLLFEFDSNGGGRIFTTEIIELLKTNKNISSDVALSLFNAVAYAYEWQGDSDHIPLTDKDMVIQEFIIDQISNPLTPEVLYTALWQSYKIAEGHERYAFVENAISANSTILSEEDKFNLRINASSGLPSKLIENIGKINTYTQAQQNEIRAAVTKVARENEIVRNDDEAKQQISLFLENNRVEFDEGFDPPEPGSTINFESMEQLVQTRDSIVNGFNRRSASEGYLYDWIEAKYISVNVVDQASFNEFIDNIYSESNDIVEKIKIIEYAHRGNGGYQYGGNSMMADDLMRSYEMAESKYTKEAIREILLNRFHIEI